MKTTLIGALVCATISAASIRIADAAAIAAPAIAAPAIVAQPAAIIEATATGDQVPTLTRVWWAGPNTICHHGYYGGAYCHPAYARAWIPGHYSWNGFWIHGHWA